MDSQSIYERLPWLGGLEGEVVTEDCYRLRGLYFIPDTVIDLGANVGAFTLFARSLWPHASIISVEPDLDNFAILKERVGDDSNTTLLNKAIGEGKIYHTLGSANGGMQVYVSKGLGFSDTAFTELLEASKIELAQIETMMLWELAPYCLGNVLIKIDIEGNEGVLLNDERSMEVVKKAQYVVIEMHYFAHDSDSVHIVKENIKSRLRALRRTHVVKTVHPLVFMHKR